MNRETFGAVLNVSRETLDRLEIFAELLRKWNPAINLVAKPTLDAIWSRHFLDSAQLLNHVPAGEMSWVDLGSGAGFPGMVVAILRPDISVTLIESDQRKCVFLREVSRACGADTTVLCNRTEDVEIKGDIVSARALAPLSKLLEMAEPKLKENGLALFLKGENVENELTDANRVWHINLERRVSRADNRGSILLIKNFYRRTDT